MTGYESEAQGKSFIEVLRRRRTVAITTFVIATVLALAFAVFYKKYVSVSHVLLVNDPSGRDTSTAAFDMPTIVTGSSILIDVQKQLQLSESINTLRKSVVAKVSPKSSLMTVSVKNSNPDLAIKINNAIGDTFVDLYWKLAGSRYDEVTRRLDADVEIARKKVRTLDRRLEQASSGASYVGSQASLDASAAHLGELKEARGVAIAQFTTDQANLQSDIARPGEIAKVVRAEILKNNQVYNQTDTLVAKDIAQYTTTRAGVMAKYPGIAGYTDKVAKESSSLDALRDKALHGRDAYSPSEAGQIVQTAKDQAAVKGDQIRLSAYDGQIAALNDRLTNGSSDNTGGDTTSIGALRAERDVAEAQLQTLGQALSNAQASSAQSHSLGQVVVVDRATEARPALLEPGGLFGLGVLAAVLLAVAAAYLAELTFPRMFDSGEVEAVYGRPIFATLRAH